MLLAPPAPALPVLALLELALVVTGVLEALLAPPDPPWPDDVLLLVALVPVGEELPVGEVSTVHPRATAQIPNEEIRSPNIHVFVIRMAHPWLR